MAYACYPMVSKALTVIRGYFNQGNAALFPATCGRQCVCNALSSLMWSQLKPLELWERQDLDSILMNGNSLYTHLSHALQQNYILPIELPNMLNLANQTFKINCGNPYFGQIDTEVSDLLSGQFALHDAILGAMSQSHSMFFTLGSYRSAFTSAIAILYITTCVGFLIATVVVHRALVWQIGTSVALVFQDIQSLIWYMNNLTMSLGLDPKRSTFEVVPVNIILVPNLSAHTEIESELQTCCSSVDLGSQHGRLGQTSCKQAILC